MYNITTDFKDYIQKPSRTFTSRLVIGANAYTDTEIVDMSLESNLVPGEEFTIGTTICNKFEATVMTTNNIFSMNVVKPYIGLNINGTVEEVPLGIFNVDNPKVTKSNTKIVAYDNMIKFEKAYFSDLIYPVAIQSVATEICQKAGVSFSSTLPSNSINKIEGKTLREALGIIAGICGGFARINRAGNLEIVGLTTTDISITTENFFGSVEKADKNFSIRKITAIKENNSTITTGSGLPSEEITFSNNYITNAQLDSIFTTYNNYSYRPLKLNWQGNPAIDVGDKITITDIDNTVYSIPVMRLKLTYQGGLKSEISSVAKSDSKSEYDYKGPVSKKVERLVIEQANIKVLMAEKANIDYLESNYAHIRDGVIDNAKIDYAAINNISSNIAAIADGRIAVAKIGASQISSVRADVIDSGTINTALVTIAGANSRLKLSGNRLQVFATKADNSLYERVSLGDVNGDGTIFGLRIRGTNGTTMLFDENGQTKEGFTDGYNKLDNDSLDPAKIDIIKVVTRINNGTTTINASKVFLNDKTLDVQFSTLSENVSNIQVGGRNLFTMQGVGKYKGGNILTFDANTVTASGYMLTAIANPGDLIGNKVINLGSSLVISGETNLTTVNIYYIFKGADNTVIQAQQNKSITVVNGKFNFNLAVPPGSAYMNIGFGQYPYAVSYWVKNVKVESGNKLTDWTPAPEDIQTQIDSSYSKITQTATAIGFDLNSQTFIENGMNKRLITTENYIEANKEKIRLAVSQTDINTSINNISIGGRNLLKTSGTTFISTAGWGYDYPTAVTKEALIENGQSLIKLTATQTGSYDMYKFIDTFLSSPLILSQNYTVSMDVRTTKVYSRLFYIRNTGTPNQTFTSDVPNTNGVWQRISMTFNFTNSNTGILFALLGSVVSGDILSFKNIKIELGNKVTDWSPAPEDVQGQIDLAVTRLNSAEVKITPDAIVSTVSKSVMSSGSPSVIIDDNDSNIIYSGAWNTVSNASNYGGTDHESNVTGNYIQYTFVGTGINVYTLKSSASGIVGISIDGGATTNVDLYNSSSLLKQKIYSSTSLSYGIHTIKISITGTKNTSATNYYIGFDYFEVLNSTAVNTSNIDTIISQSPSSVEIALKNINNAKYQFTDNGLILKNNNNQTIISADGIMQCDTVQMVDNVDSTHPLKIKLYVDDDVISIRKIKLNFSLEKFRAYEKGISSGGNYVNTTSDGGAYSNTSGSSNAYLNLYLRTDNADLSTASSSDSGYTSYAYDTGYGHSHTFSSNGHYHALGSHNHTLTISGTSQDHSHTISIAAHSHSFSIPAHAHDIQYGIYEDTIATNVDIYIDGQKKAGTYTADTTLDLTSYITTKGWHTIELTSSRLGRINASIYVKSYVSA